MDELSLREFVYTEYPRVVAAIALIAGSRAAAEDAVQEALTRAWERSWKAEEIDSLAAWVTAVSMNLARSSRRRRRAERRAVARIAGSIQTGAGAETTDRVDLRMALDRLSRRQREAIVLRYYLGLDVREVAKVMGSPEGTVKSLLARARAALATALRVSDLEEVADRGDV